MKNKKLLLGIGVLALVLVAGFLVSGRSLQGAARNARNTPAAPVTLTFAASPNPVVGGEIVAGAQAFASTGYGGVLVARYQVTASGPANNQVTITNLNFENDYDDQNPLANNGAVSQVSLHFPTSYSSPTNLNGVAFAILNLDGQAQFSGLNFKLRGGVPTQFEVQVTTNSLDLDIAAGDQIEMDLSPQYSAVNDRTGAAIDGKILPDALDGPEFTLIYGEEDYGEGEINYYVEEEVKPETEPAAASPTVNLLVNGSNGPVNTAGNVHLTWSNTNISSSMGGICTRSSSIPMLSWSGTLPSFQNMSGGAYLNVPTSRTLTLSCTTPAGTAQDSVEVNVLPPTSPYGTGDSAGTYEEAYYTPPPSTGNSATQLAQ